MEDLFIQWVILFACGAIAFSISALTAGGGALMLVPVLNFTIGVGSTAPVLNAGNLLGRPSRLILYWHDINWKAVWWYAPFALIGALGAGYLFAHTNWAALQIFVGLFLISTIFQYRWGKKKKSFYMSYPLLAPLGVIISAIGTLIGAGGPLLNPFYLNLGISKEALIGTKTMNSFIMGLAQIGSYSFFGLMSMQDWSNALALGLGITLGNVLGKKVLKKISDQNFRNWAIGFMVLSGILLIISAISSSLS